MAGPTWANESGLSETLAAEERVAPEEAAKANELADDLEKLGPTFVKLGQLLSARSSSCPRLISRLWPVCNKVEPFGFAVDTSFRIWGYPGLAIIFFLAAAGGGIALLINILFYDKPGTD